MKLKEEIQNNIISWDSSKSDSADGVAFVSEQNAQADELVELFKKWALELVGEDEDIEEFSADAVHIRNEFRGEVRKRIESQ